MILYTWTKAVILCTDKILFYGLLQNTDNFVNGIQHMLRNLGIYLKLIFLSKFVTVSHKNYAINFYDNEAIS
jgi:hypothetical protein